MKKLFILCLIALSAKAQNWSDEYLDKNGDYVEFIKKLVANDQYELVIDAFTLPKDVLKKSEWKKVEDYLKTLGEGKARSKLREMKEVNTALNEIQNRLIDLYPSLEHQK